jgi:hypothetical protein
MATIAISPLYMRDVELTIGTDDYRKHVSGVTFTPAPKSAQWTGLGENTHSAVGTPTWTCELTYAQDWDTTDSLSAYLFDHQGETKAVRFEPVSGGQAFTANVIIQAGAIGGQVDSFASTSVSLPLEGAPTLAA